MAELVFQQIKRKHKRSEFDSGDSDLNKFLREDARQNAKDGIGTTHVLTDDSKTIYGFYTLSASSLALNELPSEHQSTLPSYPEVPAILLARLAVDKRHQGQRLGETLLMKVFQDAVDMLDRVGIHLITTVAKNQQAVEFYVRYGFKAVPSNPNYLFIPIKLVKKALEQ